MKSLYLDYAATTPLSKKVLKKMRKSFSVFGNPSSLHRYGQEAFSLLEKCREDIASGVNSQNEGIIFCASATECSNLFIHSVVEEYKNVLTKPKYGYGENLNPCLDCKILM